MRRVASGLLCGCLLSWSLVGQTAERPGSALETTSATPPSPAQRLARDLLKELVEINTTHSTGSTTDAAEAMASRLKAGGVADVVVLGPEKRGNLVARWRGTGRGGKKPVLLLAHLDVVEAKREDWTVDPFKLLERDGYFYGRGSSDDKAMAAIWVATLLRLKREGFTPDRDVIVALTADEEGGGEANGVDWLLLHERERIEAAICINEGGGGVIRRGRYFLNQVQASEKVYLTFGLEVTNKGGHSSIPEKENAIYRLAEGLTKLARFDFPVHLNDITRAYFERMAALETGQASLDMKAVTEATPDGAAVARLSASPYLNAMMRTTCVATRLEAGHAENALPQSARATVNCRILPGEPPADVEKALVAVLDDAHIVVRRDGEAQPSPPSPIGPEILDAVTRVTQRVYPRVPVVPTMSTGATDGARLRRAGIPTYGVSGIFHDMDDVRYHGKDERIGVRQFDEGGEFLYALVKALSGG